MKPSIRWLSLGGLFALSIAAAVGVSRQSVGTEVAEAVERKPAPTSGHSKIPSVNANVPAPLSTQMRATIAASDINPFAPKSWYVAPPLPVVALEEIKPVAPPLPFTYKGKLGGTGEPDVFYLAKGTESYVVSVGESFADSYKLEAARDGAMTIRYLPLSTTQTLRYGLEQ